MESPPCALEAGAAESPRAALFALQPSCTPRVVFPPGSMPPDLALPRNRDTGSGRCVSDGPADVSCPIVTLEHHHRSVRPATEGTTEGVPRSGADGWQSGYLARCDGGRGSTATAISGLPPAAAATTRMPLPTAARQLSLQSLPSADGSSFGRAASKDCSNAARLLHHWNFTTRSSAVEAGGAETGMTAGSGNGEGGSGARTPCVPADAVDSSAQNFPTVLISGALPTALPMGASPKSDQQQALLHGLSTSAWTTMLTEPRARRLPRRTASVQMLMGPPRPDAAAHRPWSPTSGSATTQQDAPASAVAADQQRQHEGWPGSEGSGGGAGGPKAMRVSCAAVLLLHEGVRHRPPRPASSMFGADANAAASEHAGAAAAGRPCPARRSTSQRRCASVDIFPETMWQAQQQVGAGARKALAVPVPAGRCDSGSCAGTGGSVGAAGAAFTTLSSKLSTMEEVPATATAGDGSANSSRTALPSPPSIGAGGAMARILNITLATMSPKSSRPQSLTASPPPNSTFQLHCTPSASDASLGNPSGSPLPTSAFTSGSRLLLLRPASTFGSSIFEAQAQGRSGMTGQAAGTLPPISPFLIQQGGGEDDDCEDDDDDGCGSAVARVVDPAATAAAQRAGLHADEPDSAAGNATEVVESEAALVTAGMYVQHAAAGCGADGATAGGAAASGGCRVHCVKAFGNGADTLEAVEAQFLASLDLRPNVYCGRPDSPGSETATLRRQVFDGGEECGSSLPSWTVHDGRTSTVASGEEGAAQSSTSRSAGLYAPHLSFASASASASASPSTGACAIPSPTIPSASATAANHGRSAAATAAADECRGGWVAARRLMSTSAAAQSPSLAPPPQDLMRTLTFNNGAQPRGALLNSQSESGGCSGQQQRDQQLGGVGEEPSAAGAAQQRMQGPLHLPSDDDDTGNDCGCGSSGGGGSPPVPARIEAVSGPPALPAPVSRTGAAAADAAPALAPVLPASTAAVAAAAPSSVAQTHMEAADGDAEWHEVSLTSFLHPQLKRQVVLVVQNDVSERIWAERQLVRVVEAEHTLLENIFPHHVIEHIATTAAKTAARARGGGSERNTPDLAVMTARLSAAASAALQIDAVAAGAAPGQQDRLPAIRGSTFLHLATSHSAITVIFCDIQGFTPMCNQIRPVVVMSFLNDLFTRLDSLLDEYGVYKVETIGDCYVAAGGLMKVDPETGAVTVRSDDVDPQHAQRTVQFAKALLRAAAGVRLPTTGEPVRLRVGIHSGPAMSGVVGTRMPRFCLFGDTMNTASRMESTGLPGAIHVSAATRELVPGEAWEATGGVEVKGKGCMNTFLLRPQLA
ncbi:hypothetical protein PLESTF_001188000 [Pleodorina starrii]|nr:hypothetical protein PLESTF_001188000 [Pleodorina starrii]